jgi:hypothetical protein
MSANHSPLPWYVEHGDGIVGVHSADGEFIANCGPYEVSENCEAGDLIVRAANSHDELLAVATELASWTENPNFRLSPRLLNLIDKARAAIAKAEEREA